MFLKGKSYTTGLFHPTQLFSNQKLSILHVYSILHNYSIAKSILMAEKARLYHFEKYYSIQNRPPIPMIVTIDEFSKIWHLVQMFVKLSSPYGQKLDQNWEDWLNWDLSEQFTSNICFFFEEKKGRVWSTLGNKYGMTIHNFTPIGLKLMPYVRTDVGWHVQPTSEGLRLPWVPKSKLIFLPYIATRGHCIAEIKLWFWPLLLLGPLILQHFRSL